MLQSILKVLRDRLRACLLSNTATLWNSVVTAVRQVHLHTADVNTLSDCKLLLYYIIYINIYQNYYTQQSLNNMYGCI